MIKKTKLKQGTLLWEKARETRIGSSEVFDIVRYYATDEELQNCGINAEEYKNEKPFTTAWALFHKIKEDGLYKREALAPEFAKYGHKAEPYGVYKLGEGRTNKLKPGEVYITDNLIVSLDVSGVSEERDEDEVFVYGNGKPKRGKRFVCEQKTMSPLAMKKGLPYKYITQAQYQTTYTNADFFIIQVMILSEDTPFIRGEICQMSKKKAFSYLDENMSVKHYYFKNNIQFGELIKLCLDRFFKDVEEDREPKAYIETDNAKNIIESIRINSFYNDKKVQSCDLERLERANKLLENAKEKRLEEVQRITELARENNCCRFASENGLTAMFAKDGSLRLKAPKERSEA